MAKKPITFEQALDHASTYSKKHLLLGNGFSIACRPSIFTYGRLYDEADFSQNPNLQAAFDALGTTDFESVIRSLGQTARLVPVYNAKQKTVDKIKKDAAALKDILVRTVAANHPKGPFDIVDSEFTACRSFLSHFLSAKDTGSVFTLNYDLLLYWTLMRSNENDDPNFVELAANDGFGNDEDDPEAKYVVWQGEGSMYRTRVFYLHGALHLFDAGPKLKKFTWNRTDEPLIDQTRGAMDDDKFPLFVSEGTSSQKMDRIRHNAYLYQGLKTWAGRAKERQHCFFIHGHSLAENDEHVFGHLGKGKCRSIYVSIHGDINSDSNQEIVKRARYIESLRSSPELEVIFYDAASANVWGRDQ